jgi:purine-nucleoside phosphorylase
MSKNSKFKLGIILGSGLDVIADSLSGKETLSEELDGIHYKKVILVHSDEFPMVLFCGRRHFYEGYSRDETIGNITKAREIGIKYILITNAAGGLNENFEVSDLMLINSHITLNPKLKGSIRSFPYDKDLMNRFKEICNKQHIKFFDGVYTCLQGPAYETQAEIKFQKKAGADAAGMSTVPEVNEAVKQGIKVLGVSVITNLLKENCPSQITHQDVLKTSKKASEKLLFVVKRLANELK